MTFDDVIDWMTMVADEMKGTNFLNATGFVGYSDFNWEGLMDEEMQEFVMEHGERDNNNAWLFVEQMRIITLKKWEDHAIEEGDVSNSDDDIELEDLNVTLDDEDRREAEEVEELEQQNSTDVSDDEKSAMEAEDDATAQASSETLSKTQDSTAEAKAQDASAESAETPGRGLP